jgi:hypothetical protein
LLCLILGLALAIERIIYLNMATTDTDKLLSDVEVALQSGGVESAKEVFNTKQEMRIRNHEGAYGNDLTFNDKYYRETFFVSVHTRNLAKHIAISEQTGTSIGVSSTYN